MKTSTIIISLFAMVFEYQSSLIAAERKPKASPPIKAETDAPEINELDQEIQRVESDTPIMTLKPGETVTIIRRTETQVRPSTLKTVQKTEAPQVKVVEAPQAKPVAKPIVAPWRCKNIPDEAFVQLAQLGKKKRPGRAEWESKAVEFMLKYAKNCPSYEALEKELPAFLAKKKYTDMLAVIYQINASSSRMRLLKIAREDELTKEREKFELQYASTQPAVEQLAEHQEKFEILGMKARAAKEILKVKYPNDILNLTEARDFLNVFVSRYLDKSYNVKVDSIPALKTFVRKLSPQRKNALKEYTFSVLLGKEYPKSNLVIADLNGAKQGSREPAAASKKELSQKAAVQTLLWELQ